IAGYVWRISAEARRLERAYAASQAALSREQRLAALGGLAAAAAHELGTPLATISLVASELARTIPADTPEGEDVALLVSQAERCRQILAELSAGPEQHGEHPFETMALPVLVDLAAAPHRIEGIGFTVATDSDGEPPMFRRTPELIHA